MSNRYYSRTYSHYCTAHAHEITIAPAQDDQIAIDAPSGVTVNAPNTVAYVNLDLVKLYQN